MKALAPEPDVEVVGEPPEPEALRLFWRAFASIAADLLDEDDLGSDDQGAKEAAAR
ncbi:hypothetical protein [Anaeromyxobacter dehalogenans]|uniref:hypothetical protein n=1 Tax=Anaeromyxobacter dehalogenans TaxID=161493 RepID=UPI0012EE5F18|nr:hypothetical protein [Anaeromyxobacter dehalogenans]